MSNSISVKGTLNREYLPPNRESIVYLALDILPPDANQGGGAFPTAICLLIDRSGSMAGEKLNQAKAAAHQVLDQLQSTDYVGIVAFCGWIDKVADVKQVQSVDVAALKRKIADLEAEATTELYDGLETAYQQVVRAAKSTGDMVKRVILLSDGLPTDDVPITEYARLAREMRETGISVVTLGIGEEYDEDLLASIAEHSGGVWKHISSPSEIPAIFSQQLEEAKTVVHMMPEVLMHLSKGVELKEVYKAMPDVYRIGNLKQRGADVAIPLSDVRRGESQTLVAKLGVPPRPEGQCRLLKAQIANEPESLVDIIATYTSDQSLWGIENNAFPRGIYLTAETQVLTRAGLSGDQTALKQAEQRKDTILKDPNLTAIQTIHETVVKINETIAKSKVGLTEEETKIAKEGMTQIQRR